MRLLPLISRTAAAVSFLVGACDASAHPHVWVKVKTVLVVEGGLLTGLKHTWVFDESFLASQLDEHDADKDGRLSAEELAPVAVESQQTLDTFKSFTVVRAGGALIRAVKPRDVVIGYHSAVLGMSFTVSLAKPIPLKGDMLLEVYDATYFSSFAFEGAGAVVFAGEAPAGCAIKTDASPSPQQMRDYRQMLKEIGPELVKPFTPRSVAISCGVPQLAKDAGTFVGEATGAVQGAPAKRATGVK
jgi:ABC-type uncharacterized transport system substrate-binding protein